jgi:hypothetical protein
MIAKSLFAASALAAGLLAVQPNAAEAKASVDINVYLPGMGGYDPGYPGSGYGYFGYAPVNELLSGEAVSEMEGLQANQDARLRR